MKAHIGVDAKSKPIHSVAATAANVHDKHLLPQLPHGEETRVFGDSAYSGQSEAIGQAAPNAKDFTNKRPYRNRPLSEREEQNNHNQSKVRAKVEHPFLVIKRIFAFAKVRYGGLTKNANRLFVTCALANLYMVRGHLIQLQ
jgi:transposase, IS5 family